MVKKEEKLLISFLFLSEIVHVQVCCLLIVAYPNNIEEEVAGAAGRAARGGGRAKATTEGQEALVAVRVVRLHIRQIIRGVQRITAGGG